ncbi:WcbI family polysaccharide biosynthesis putative acetyltransferase [Henriciella marina]|uniref:WcbI family polysaccharide biosynthesis putative acetyltransferase n=1 Tax=Henriciella marina TaxID=453851 RepID=UPI00037598AF|nr:WcbI family polysaccharide biosynthesis putative acetyltransferase [Henriciella marina]
MRKIFFYGNCQLLALHDLLTPVLKAHGFTPVHVEEVYKMTPADEEASLKAAAEAELMICQPVIEKPNRPSTPALQTLSASSLVIPSIHFTGYHPNLQLLWSPQKRGTGCLSTWALVRAGFGPKACEAALLDPGAFDAEDVRTYAAGSMAELKRRERKDGIDIPMSDVLETSSARALYTINHPTRDVMVILCDRILDELTTRGLLPKGLPGLARDAHFEQAMSSLDFIDHRPLPTVAKALGVDGPVASRNGMIVSRERFTLEGASPLQALTIPKLARQYARELEQTGWDDRIAENDRLADAIPRPKVLATA